MIVELADVASSIEIVGIDEFAASAVDVNVAVVAADVVGEEKDLVVDLPNDIWASFAWNS